MTEAANSRESFDAVVIGGGPSGATAAGDLAAQGREVLLLDKAGRIKPCGGAVPPRLIEEFEIPLDKLVARIKTARMVSPKNRQVDIPIKDGFVGMVDRDVFDEWLRQRAAASGASRRTGQFTRLSRDPDGTSRVHYRCGRNGEDRSVRARAVIGADGARSGVARQAMPDLEPVPSVFAYHEIVSTAHAGSDFDPSRCDVYYQGMVSPDFYGWVFPHGETASIGVGSANKGFSLRQAVTMLRANVGLTGTETVRCEGAPIPLRPASRWDDGRNVLLAGDAAGVVAPASGEGIYYAMTSGRLAAEAVHAYCATGDARELGQARRRFMRVHGQVFWILGIMQRYWYTTDGRRERFVSICRDRDVQELTFEAYMQKALVKARPAAHVRIFFKNIAHLTGLLPA